MCSHIHYVVIMDYNTVQSFHHVVQEFQFLVIQDIFSMMLKLTLFQQLHHNIPLAPARGSRVSISRYPGYLQYDVEADTIPTVTYQKRSNNTTSNTLSTGSTEAPKGSNTWLESLNSPLIQDTGDNKMLKLRFDVSQYQPEEIVVKTVDNKLLVSSIAIDCTREAKHRKRECCRLGLHYRQEQGIVVTQQGSLLAGLYLRQKPMCHLNLGNHMDVQERHTTNRKCRDSGVQGQFDRSSLLREMTDGVGGVRSLTSEVLASLNKGMPSPVCFDWRRWFRAGLPFFRDMSGPYPQPYPFRISCHSGSSAKVLIGLGATYTLLVLREGTKKSGQEAGLIALTVRCRPKLAINFDLLGLSRKPNSFKNCRWKSAGTSRTRSKLEHRPALTLSASVPSAMLRRGDLGSESLLVWPDLKTSLQSATGVSSSSIRPRTVLPDSLFRSVTTRQHNLVSESLIISAEFGIIIVQSSPP
ncbi:Belongs to the small heat shock protein (HSP20) [Homalodisca vitripennis]|nr:Belongs to the small heat shock protein (HSP20) [Homalodisca vitripennis]